MRRSSSSRGNYKKKVYPGVGTDSLQWGNRIKDRSWREWGYGEGVSKRTVTGGFGKVEERLVRLLRHMCVV